MHDVADPGKSASAPTIYEREVEMARMREAVAASAAARRAGMRSDMV